MMLHLYEFSWINSIVSFDSILCFVLLTLTAFLVIGYLL